MRQQGGYLYGDYLSEAGLFAHPLLQKAADPFGGMVYINDFLRASDLDLTNDWTETDVGTMTLDPSTFIVTDEINGVLALDSDATDGDGIHLQLTGAGGPGEFLLPAAGRVIGVQFRITHEDWDAQHWFVGLAETSATLMDADGDLTADTLVGFHHNADDDADGIPRLVNEGVDGSQLTQAASRVIAAGVDDTYRTMGIRLVGTTGVEWWVDGIKVGEKTMASAFDDNLCISLANVMQAASGDQLRTDLIVAAATR